MQFQFHYGSIKITGDLEVWFSVLQFQFHYGSIKIHSTTTAAV